MIQRILLLILIPVIAISAISCDDLEDNSPALQVMVNGELFKAKEMQVFAEEDGGYTITGLNDDIGLSIYLNNAAEGSYTLGEESKNNIMFVSNKREYITRTHNGSGDVRITSVGELDYLTGSFHFLATATDTSEARKRGANGHFYHVPFESEKIDLPETDVVLDNEATFVVNEEDVNITNIEAHLVEGQIEVVITGENDQHIVVRVNQTVAEGLKAMPNENVFFVYVLNEENKELTTGRFNVLSHEVGTYRLLEAEFEGITEGGHEISGSFQVSY